MNKFIIFVLLSYLTGNPLLVLLIMLLAIFFLERRFVGLLPDLLGPWRRAKRIRQLKRDIAINPANAESYLELGEAYFKQGKYEAAISFLESASNKMEGHPLFHFCLGASYYECGRVSNGKEELEKAIKANPKVSMGEPYVYLVKIYLEEGLPGEKIEHAFKQLLLYGSPEVFCRAGRHFLRGYDRERARRLFHETIESYEVCRGSLRRKYRRWAILARVSLSSMGRGQS
ncbi:MAG: tetratricopeptide repeat protein [Desulfotomaculaceae bacterium]|nr:tetratricopeptide repeat protein [Desulfotomaculaceae bacterium]MDD4767012.1 tetratricopeptide repeat protein [Desulfotomaculaceae bacterium]